MATTPTIAALPPEEQEPEQEQETLDQSVDYGPKNENLPEDMQQAGAELIRLFMEQDTDKSGCAITKNRAIQRAYDAGAEVIVVLDDDCFPTGVLSANLAQFAEYHTIALLPQPVEMFKAVTEPASRGTPYFNRHVTMPVAASMGFWTEIGDYDAPGQLVHGARRPMAFKHKPIHGQYFPLCGMNLAFHREWWPVAQFINVARFDDIWQGFIWEKIAYSRGYCFNLGGPLVRHSRQSNVWANLRDESINLEANETLWSKIHAHPSTNYDELRALLPVP